MTFLFRHRTARCVRKQQRLIKALSKVFWNSLMRLNWRNLLERKKWSWQVALLIKYWKKAVQTSSAFKPSLTFKMLLFWITLTGSPFFLWIVYDSSEFHEKPEFSSFNIFMLNIKKMANVIFVFTSNWFLSIISLFVAFISKLKKILWKVVFKFCIISYNGAEVEKIDFHCKRSYLENIHNQMFSIKWLNSLLLHMKILQIGIFSRKIVFWNNSPINCRI